MRVCGKHSTPDKLQGYGLKYQILYFPDYLFPAPSRPSGVVLSDPGSGLLLRIIQAVRISGQELCYGNFLKYIHRSARLKNIINPQAEAA